MIPQEKMTPAPDSPRRPALAFLLHVSIPCLVLLVLLRGFVFETFYVPTGSMAPTLHGEHRLCSCPRCGNEVIVGKHAGDAGGAAAERFYRKAFCPWCGESIPVAGAPLRSGERVLVDKFAYLWRLPRRWEIVVLWINGEYVIKRVLGLPGDEVELRGGDVYIDGALLRKSWEEIEALRIPLFDQDLPGPDGWRERWEQTKDSSAQPVENAIASRLIAEGVTRIPGSALRLEGATRFAYRNFSYAEAKCLPLTDEQAYNGALHANWETVHDFSVSAQVLRRSEAGAVTFALNDGEDIVSVRLPLTGHAPVRIQRQKETLAEVDFAMPTGAFTLDLAFVDRRILVRIDGRAVGEPVDLPPATRRLPVTLPLGIAAEGADVEVRRVKLYRDVHYTQAGVNAVRGRSVQLGTGQYFVLGDNSGRSEDSRFWRDQGAVPHDAFIGRVLNH